MNFPPEYKLQLIRDIERDIIINRKSFQFDFHVTPCDYVARIFGVNVRETKNLSLAFSARIMIENELDKGDVVFLFHEFEVKFNHLSGEWK